MFEFAKIHLDKTEKEFSSLFWDYVVNIEKMKDYYNQTNQLNVVIEISKKGHLEEQDVYILKNIMQNDFQYGHLSWYINKRNEELKQFRNKIFLFLDLTKNPYQFIFTPIWFNSYKRYDKGFYPYQSGGVNEITIFVAGEYAKHKLNA